MRKIRPISILFLAFFLLPFSRVICQEGSYRLEIVSNQAIAESNWIKELNESKFEDSISVVRALQGLRSRFYKKGYIGAGFDSLEYSAFNVRAAFSPGLKYNWGRLTIPEDYPSGTFKLKGQGSLRPGKILTIEKTEEIRESLVRIYENQGYPFASVRYDSLVFNNGIVDARLNVDSGPFILIDSLVIRTEDIISRKILTQITGLKPGQPYSEKKILYAGRQMDNSEIIQSAGPLEVGFVKDKAWIYLSPSKKQSNSFDGIVGLVPGASNSAGISLTGSLDLKLNNMLKQAESLSIRWKSPANGNQRLEGALSFPYFLGWPIGFASRMELFKKDSSYLNTDWSIGVQASLRTNSRIEFYYREKSSNVLLSISNPDFSDVSTRIYGVNWGLEQLENPFNPRKGLNVRTDFGIGNKKRLTENQDDENQLYTEAKGMSEFFIPIRQALVIKLGARAAYLNGGRIFMNEKYKIGGIYTLRGFDEESILADSYFLGTLELRYLFTRNSNFHVFADGGKWWSEAMGDKGSGTPLGFGLGISLETKAGVILLDYALGVSEEIKLNLRNGKIHLGIKSIF